MGGLGQHGLNKFLLVSVVTVAAAVAVFLLLPLALATCFGEVSPCFCGSCRGCCCCSCSLKQAQRASERSELASGAFLIHFAHSILKRPFYKPRFPFPLPIQVYRVSFFATKNTPQNTSEKHRKKHSISAPFWLLFGSFLVLFWLFFVFFLHLAQKVLFGRVFCRFWRPLTKEIPILRRKNNIRQEICLLRSDALFGAKRGPK